LYSTTLSIKEIGFQVGFSDEKYFMKVFKKLEGLSPSQYRHAFYLLHQNQH
jgi:YesN/AraC family two-component response regulator